MRLGLLASVVALFALAGGAPREASAEAVKHLLPNQYQSRIVAPKKGRVLLVNFWATWCVPCRKELPALVAASKAFKAKDVAFVLISLDSEKTGPTTVPKFLAAERVPLVCWLLKAHDPEPFINTVDRSWSGALPHTLIYDRKGRLFRSLPNEQDQATFVKAVQQALAVD